MSSSSSLPPIPLWVTNNTANELQVVGLNGVDIALDGFNVVGAHSANIHIASFTPPLFGGDHWDWVYLRDAGTGAEYQLFIEASVVLSFGTGTNASFGYRDDSASRTDSNPSPIPDGCSTAQWLGITDQLPPGAPSQLVVYTLLKTPPPAPMQAVSTPIASAGSSYIYFVRSKITTSCGSRRATDRSQTGTHLTCLRQGIRLPSRAGQRFPRTALG